jgi:hypothetical protein
LDLHRIAVRKGQLGRREEVDGDPIQQRVVRDDTDRALREIVERERHADEVRLLEQTPHAPDHLGRTLIVADDVREACSRLLEIEL